METKEKLTLSELNGLIKETLRENFQHPYWITAEISEMNINASGHCYLELIEKEPDSDHIVARARAVVWAYTFRILKPYFETTTGRPLAPGLKILIQVEISFHEIYGLSLTVKDIDPGFTIGEMALRRKEIIDRLQREGVFDMNRQLSFPLVPQRIAIISSATAAGYQDFIHQVTHQPYGYHFNLTLFPAVMQGKDAEQTLIGALEEIYEREEDFDLVVIIRGGGSQADLSCFDNYRLASYIAQFPLPVLTGIGHEKDETVADLVAFTNLKTPTAVAEFILNRVLEFEERMNDISAGIYQKVKEKIFRHHTFLEHYAYSMQVLLQKQLNEHMRKIDLLKHGIIYTTENIYHTQKKRLYVYKDNLTQKMPVYFLSLDREIRKHKELLIRHSRQYLLEIKYKLDIKQKSLTYLNPENILQRGYSITRIGDKAIKNAQTVRQGDIMTTRFFKGKIKSKVIK